MAKKQIITIPNPLLRKISEPVKSVDKEVKNLLDDMLETMYAAPGIGLAAVQIGILKRLIVIDLSKDGEKNTFIHINPEIISKSNDLFLMKKGCLSIPNQFAEVKRPSACKINFIDYNGKKKEMSANGLLATCITT